MPHTDIPDEPQQGNRATQSTSEENMSAHSNQVDNLVKHMVDRFLAWHLPEDFSPDAGIRFTPVYRGVGGMMAYNPTGTNLFTATQATELFRYLLEGSDLVLDDQEANTDATNPPDQTSPSTDEVEQIISQACTYAIAGVTKPGSYPLDVAIIAEAKAAIQSYVARRELAARISELELLIGTHNNDPSVDDFSVIRVTRDLLNKRMEYLYAERTALEGKR